MRFKIMHGTHTSTDPRTKADKTWKVGEVIDTDEDLRKYNGAGMSPKYQLLDGGPEAAANAPHGPSNLGA